MVRVTLYALDLGEQVAFNLSDLDKKCDLTWEPPARLGAYTRLGWRGLCSKPGYPCAGMQAVYTSDIPIGAGLSSSAAVEVAFATTWQALSGLEHR